MLALLLLWFQAGGSPQVRMGIDVTPDTVTVGQPFLVRIRIRAPLGSEILFPTQADSGATVGLLAHTVTEPTSDGTFIERTGGYRLAAWDVGDQPLGLADVIVRVGGLDRRLSLSDAKVHVRSVLPADSALRVPKPARPPMAERSFMWLWWLLAAILLALLAWWLWRWWSRRRSAPPDPYLTALAELDRIDASGLLARGERALYVARVADAVRAYLAGRVLGVRLSHTTSELLTQVAGDLASERPRVAALLQHSDLAKFARVDPSSDVAAWAGAEAREVIRAIEARVVARATTEPKEAKAA